MTAAALGSPAPATRREGARWRVICRYTDLEPERGVAALVAGRPVALFRAHDGQLYAVDNIDPFSGASVLARGIVGTCGDAVTIASPMHKQVFDLRTGRCLDDPAVTLACYPVRCRDGLVEVRG